MNSFHPTKEIIHSNAVDWLEKSQVLPGVSIISSLPDYSEFSHLSLQEWKDWFVNACKLCMKVVDPDGLCIFFQTDIKHQGEWVDKSFLCMKAAQDLNFSLQARKVVCRVPSGMITFGRPAYSHLLVFSKNLKLDPAKSTADVIPHAGKTTWTRGMGVKACEAACNLVKTHSQSHTVLDPFCGHGSVLAMANSMGLNAIGVEISKKRAKRANNLQLSELI